MKLNMSTYSMTGNDDIKVHGKHVERDISWFDFNKRVLNCARYKKNPINERLNFLAITESNLDEFIEVRFGKAFNNKEELPYKEELKKIEAFKIEQNRTYTLLENYIKEHKGYKIVKNINKLGKRSKKAVRKAYFECIYPSLIAFDVEFNQINILSRIPYIAVVTTTDNRDKLTVIPINKNIDPLFIVGNKIIPVETIIRYYMPRTLFNNQEIKYAGVFRVLKDGSEILSHNEEKLYLDRMEDVVRSRTLSKCLYLETTKDCCPELLDMLCCMYKIKKSHVFNKKELINYKSLQERIFEGEKDSYKPFIPRRYEKSNCYENMFDAIDNEDILLHHPYDSYDTVVKFIQDAARDKHVETIRQTLYRASGINSPIVNALCDAADNGKFVSVLVEIKARYDEENNIHIINKLKSHGVNVVLGDEYLKTHGKLCIVTRKVNGKCKLYAHIATGNYNEKTARIYTDLSLFTSNYDICNSMIGVFNILTGHSKPDDGLKKVFYSPINIRSQLYKRFDKEIEAAKKGHHASVKIKVNSLSDPGMENKIYEAAKAGVKITIICRGVCSIVATKNITIKSVVGRFLEHSRIFVFENSQKEDGEKFYIASADLLTRNLDRRVEVMVPIKSEKVQNQLRHIMLALENDTDNSFVMDKHGKYVRPEIKDKKKRANCHELLMS